MTKICIDISCLSIEKQKNSARSGIFQCVKQLVLTMLKNDECDILFYCKLENYLDFCEISKKLYPSINIITDINYANEYFFKKYSKFCSMQNLSFLQKFKKKIYRKLTFLNKRISKKNLEIISKNDFFFAPMETIPSDIKKLDIKKIQIIYDMIPLIFPETYGFDKNGWFFKVIKNINKNDYYFTISKSVMNDFIKYCGDKIDVDKCYTTYIGVSKDFHQYINDDSFMAVSKKYNLHSVNYIFSLCSIEERKNLFMQIESFIKFIKKHEITDFIYILGGGQNSYHNILKKLNFSDEELKYIQYIGYVDDEDLPILYSYAKWFTFTSKYEGFGLPPVEAMKCGCPVVASNNSSLPEVCGDSALLIDYNDESQHIAAYEKYYFDEEYRQKNINTGLIQVKKFEWNTILDNMLSIMKNLK